MIWNDSELKLIQGFYAFRYFIFVLEKFKYGYNEDINIYISLYSQEISVS